MVDENSSDPLSDPNSNCEGEEIKRRSPEEQAAILRSTGSTARQARRQVRLDKQGIRRNTFTYPEEDDALVKAFMKLLRETRGEDRSPVVQFLKKAG